MNLPQKIFMGYLTAGDGGIKRTLEAALALIAGGVNVLEIGVPFSDPIADGPVIQQACVRALTQGVSLTDILWLTQQIRQRTSVPIILYSYLNPLLAVFDSGFAKTLLTAGINGVLLVDCPLEETVSFYADFISQNIAPIYLIAPTTPPERMRTIAKQGRGFLYYACRKGTTGMRNQLPADFSNKIAVIKKQVDLPVVAGIGISDADTAKKVIQHADGVVVGSLFVEAVAKGMSANELTQLAARINPL